MAFYLIVLAADRQIDRRAGTAFCMHEFDLKESQSKRPLSTILARQDKVQEKVSGPPCAIPRETRVLSPTPTISSGAHPPWLHLLFLPARLGIAQSDIIIIRKLRIRR